MAGGGHAPKVAVHDVAALIGAVLLVSSLSLLFIPFEKQSGESFITDDDYHTSLHLQALADAIHLDLISGDSVTININSQIDCIDCLNIYNFGPGEVPSVDYWKDSSPSFVDGDFNSTEYKFKANESGTFTLIIVGDSDGPIEWDLEIQRRWMQPYLMPLLGAAILGWGIWQGQQIDSEEDTQED